MSDELTVQENVAKELLSDAGIVPADPVRQETIPEVREQAPPPAVNAELQQQFNTNAAAYQSRANELARAEQALQAEWNQLHGYLQSQDYANLQAHDPGQAALNYQHALGRLSQLEQTWNSFNPHRAQLGHLTREMAVAQTRQMIPEWQDQRVMQREAQEIVNYAVKQGYDRNVVVNMMDPKHVKVFRDAWLASQVSKGGRRSLRAIKSIKKTQATDLDTAIARRLAANAKRGITSKDSRLTAVSQALEDMGISL